jgi:hypothetical protein
VGKYADLVILEKNLFDLDPHDIAGVKVEATMMDGKFTYQAAEKTSRSDAISPYAQLASTEFFRHFYCDHPASQGHDHTHGGH